MLITIIFAFVSFSAFAQSYKDFDYSLSRQTFDMAMFERGIKGKTNIPPEAIETLIKTIKNGHVTVFPNQNKVVWNIDTVKSIMAIEGGKQFMEMMATAFTLFCGNFRGNYLYYCDGWLTTDKKFFEYSESFGGFSLYEVW